MEWAYVQGVAFADDVASPNVAAMPGPVTVGNTIIVIANHSYEGCPPSVTDSLGNTYTPKGDHRSGGSGHSVWCFTAPITNDGTPTITITYACGSSRSAFALEYSGLQADPFDQQNAKSNAEVTSETGSVNTTTDGQLILSHFKGVVVPTWTSDGGATTRLITANRNDIIQDQLQTSAGAIEASATASSFYSALYGYIFTFKATVTAAGQPKIKRIATIPHLAGSLRQAIF